MLEGVCLEQGGVPAAELHGRQAGFRAEHPVEGLQTLKTAAGANLFDRLGGTGQQDPGFLHPEPEQIFMRSGTEIFPEQRMQMRLAHAREFRETGNADRGPVCVCTPVWAFQQLVLLSVSLWGLCLLHLGTIYP